MSNSPLKQKTIANQTRASEAQKVRDKKSEPEQSAHVLTQLSKTVPFLTARTNLFYR